MILQILILILLIVGCFHDLKTRMVPRYYTTLPIVLLSIPLIRFELASLLISSFLTAFLIAVYMLKKMGLADLIVLIPLILTVNNALIFWIVFNVVGLATMYFTGKNIPAFVPITIAYAVTMW